MAERNDNTSTPQNTGTTPDATQKPAQGHGTPGAGRTDAPAGDRKEGRDDENKNIPDPARTTAKDTADTTSGQGSAK